LSGGPNGGFGLASERRDCVQRTEEMKRGEVGCARQKEKQNKGRDIANDREGRGIWFGSRFEG
jgi:hypothetical protein